MLATALRTGALLDLEAQAAAGSAGFVGVVRLAGREEMQRPLRRLWTAMTAPPVLTVETAAAAVDRIDGAAV